VEKNLRGVIIPCSEGNNKTMIDPTTGLEVANPTADETAKNDPLKTGADDSEKNNQGVKTKEEIVAELAVKFKDATPEQLLEEMAKQNEIISHKNRAINSLKVEKETLKPKEDLTPKKTVDQIVAEAATKAAEEASKKLNENFNLDKGINSLSATEAERKLIRDAYNNDIVKTGDLEKDLQKAFAIANQAVISEIRKNKSEAEANEMIMTRFSSGQNVGQSNESGIGNDPVKKAAAANLRLLKIPEAEIEKLLEKI
jgi:hypothetical protein